MSLFKKNLVGIDVGAHSIKIVALKGSLGSYSLKASTSARLKTDADATGQKEAVSSFVLSGVLKSMGLRGAKSASALSGQSVSFRHIYLPQMPEKELKEAIKWEIRKEVPVAPAELVSDYVFAHNGGRPSENSLSIIAFAAKRGDVGRLIGLFKDAGAELQSLEAVPTALLASFDANNEWEEGVNYSMCDIGSETSTLAIFKDKALAFVREISFGGDDITEAVATAMNLDNREADLAKTEQGLDAILGAGGDTGPVRRSLNVFCNELHRSFDYYQAQFREGAVTKLFVSGGTACLSGIENFITETTGVPCFIDNPFRNIVVPKEHESMLKIAPLFTVATGLATRQSK